MKLLKFVRYRDLTTTLYLSTIYYSRIEFYIFHYNHTFMVLKEELESIRV